MSSIVTQALLNQAVVCDGNALLLNLAEATLVDELAHGLQVGISERETAHTREVTLQSNQPTSSHTFTRRRPCLLYKDCHQIHVRYGEMWFQTKLA